MPDSSNDHKIPKLQGSKGFALWRIYVMELMRKDGVLYVLTQDPPEQETSTQAAVSRFRKDDEKARPHIVLNIGEEPATIITSLLLAGATTKAVWEKLTDTYHKENIQSKLNLRTKLHNLQLKEESDLQAHLTQLEEILLTLQDSMIQFHHTTRMEYC